MQVLRASAFMACSCQSEQRYHGSLQNRFTTHMYTFQPSSPNKEVQEFFLKKERSIIKFSIYRLDVVWKIAEKRQENTRWIPQ